MSDFPHSAEEFYAMRDDRTNRCSGSREYQKTACAVHLSSKVASTARGQVMFLVAANLLSRWCRKVAFVLPRIDAHPALGMGQGDLGQLILAQMRDADPFGDFRVVPDCDATAEVALCIGSECRPSSPVVVFINTSGWLASISTKQSIEICPAEDRNWLGAIAAACLGVGQLFKIAVGMPSANYIRDGILDVFKLDWSEDLRQAQWPADLNVGKILMVGAGSVGSSAAYCMRLIGLGGTITVIDKDIVKVENFNRSPIYGRGTFGLGKAEAVATYLGGSTLAASPVSLWWDEFLQQQRRASLNFDLWLPLANEFGVRSAIQHNVPPLMIHASTSANWGVNHGRHIPGRDDCLLDRFPVEVSAGDLTCATGEVRTSDVAIDAALPFASLFAGLLITADLVRAQLPEYPHIPNFALFDWYGALDIIQAWDREPRAGCVCREQGRGLHDKFNRGTRHRQHFRFR